MEWMGWMGWNSWGWNGWDGIVGDGMDGMEGDGRGLPTTITANTTANLTAKTSFNNPISMVYP